MNIVLAVVLLLVGFVLLIKGADIFVDGSSSIAKMFGIPSIIVGLTIVAIGTSLPEAAVSISAALKGSNAIAVSNVVGSNMFNILIVLGLSSLVKTTAVGDDVLKRDFPFCIGSAALLLVFSADALFKSKVLNNIDLLDSKQGEVVVGNIRRVEGLILFAGFIIYIVLTVVSALKSINNDESTNEKKDKSGIAKNIIFIVLGIAAIAFGGDMVVDNAKKIALAIGMSETLVGLTIVAIGTSLPELVTSIVAIVKGENDMALGNVIGSNITNILFVLGMSGLLNPIKVTFFSCIDLTCVVVITVLCAIAGATKKKISRIEGGAGILIYIAYVAYTIIR